MAWLRTAISVMAFGFIVEKFDLFLSIASLSMGGHSVVLPSQKLGNETGLALVFLGAAMIVVAGQRFWSTAKAIDSTDLRTSPRPHVFMALAAFLLLAAGTLLFYLLKTLMR